MTYSEEALKRLVSKKGIQYAIQTLSSPNLPKEIKSDLTKKNYFIGGHPNISLISSLV